MKRTLGILLKTWKISYIIYLKLCKVSALLNVFVRDLKNIYLCVLITTMLKIQDFKVTYISRDTDTFKEESSPDEENMIQNHVTHAADDTDNAHCNGHSAYLRKRYVTVNLLE